MHIFDFKLRYKVKSGVISVKAGRYYISVLVEIPNAEPVTLANPGIGIDLGVKDLAILSDGRVYKNINKTTDMKRLEKKLRRAQRSLSRKHENKKKGGATRFKNMNKQRLEVQRLHHKLDCIRSDHVNKVISEIVKTKPSYVTIEDLNVSGMMKNKHLSKAIASQKLYKADRDYNASLNLRDAKIYTVA